MDEELAVNIEPTFLQIANSDVTFVISDIFPDRSTIMKANASSDSFETSKCFFTLNFSSFAV